MFVRFGVPLDSRIRRNDGSNRGNDGCPAGRSARRYRFIGRGIGKNACVAVGASP